jgi:cytoskeletal protein CcmA (bactofilin family)
VALFGKKEKDRHPFSTGLPEQPTPKPSERHDARTEPDKMPPLKPYLSGSPVRESFEGAGTEIGQNVRLNGEVEGDEDMVVNGRLEGLLNLKKNLVVGKTGVVVAEIHAASVTIHGEVNGNIVAVKKVEIAENGKLEGNIKSPKIQIHEGAHFKGNVDMSTAPILEKVPSSATEEKKPPA